MAAITATIIAIASPALVGGLPIVYIVSSSAAVYSFNFNTSVWKPLPMLTT